MFRRSSDLFKEISSRKGDKLLSPIGLLPAFANNYLSLSFWVFEIWFSAAFWFFSSCSLKEKVPRGSSISPTVQFHLQSDFRLGQDESTQVKAKQVREFDQGHVIKIDIVELAVPQQQLFDFVFLLRTEFIEIHDSSTEVVVACVTIHVPMFRNSSCFSLSSARYWMASPVSWQPHTANSFRF